MAGLFRARRARSERLAANALRSEGARTILPAAAGLLAALILGVGAPGALAELGDGVAADAVNDAAVDAVVAPGSRVPPDGAVTEVTPFAVVAAGEADSLRREVRLARILQDPGRLARAEYGQRAFLERSAAAMTGAAAEVSVADLHSTLRLLLEDRHPSLAADLVDRYLTRRAQWDPAGELSFWFGLVAHEHERYDTAVELWTGPMHPLLRPYADWLSIRALDELAPERVGARACSLLHAVPRHRFRDLLALRAGRALVERQAGAEEASWLRAWTEERGSHSSMGARGLTLLAEVAHQQGQHEVFEQLFATASGAGGVHGEEARLRCKQARRLLSGSGELEDAVLIGALESLARHGPGREALGFWRERASRLGREDSLRVGRLLLGRLYGDGCHEELLDLCRSLSHSRDGVLWQRALVVAGRVHRRLGERDGLVRSWKAAAGWDDPRPLELAQDADQDVDGGPAGGTEQGADQSACVSVGIDAQMAAQALWELGRELEDLREWAAADSAFTRLAEWYPADGNAREARLRAALCRDSAGRRAEALAALAALCAQASDRFVGSPCFWQALLEGKDADSVLAARAAAEYRPGFHALRTAEALRSGFWPPSPSADSLFWRRLSEQVQVSQPAGPESAPSQPIQPEFASSQPIQPEFASSQPSGPQRSCRELAWPPPPGRALRSEAEARRIVEMIDGHPMAEAGMLMRAFGYRTWARDLWRDLPGYNALDDRGRAALYRALGDFPRSILMGLRLGDVLPERYPMGFLTDVYEAGRSAGLTPVFLLAVMRQESMLDPTGRSSAGARGLMQLMPGTARRLADEGGLFDYELERPRDNLMLGAAHLRELLDRVDGAVPMALAAYNAGWENALRWLPPEEAPPELSGWDAYIERITYGETRRFVKSVLMHYWSYLRGYAWGLSFPTGVEEDREVIPARPGS